MNSREHTIQESLVGNAIIDETIKYIPLYYDQYYSLSSYTNQSINTILKKNIMVNDKDQKNF
jgi:hypothetical protein